MPVPNDGIKTKTLRTEEGQNASNSAHSNSITQKTNQYYLNKSDLPVATPISNPRLSWSAIDAELIDDGVIFVQAQVTHLMCILIL